MADMLNPPAALPAPTPNQAYVHVSALEAGLITLPLHLITPGEPADAVRTCPSLAFFVQHAHAPDRHFVFDLGLRRDFASYPPPIQALVRDTMPCAVPQTVDESVQTVVISHLHFDHIGDHTPFTNATFILGGDGAPLLADGYPANPTSRTLAASVPPSRTRFLAPSDFSCAVGPFPAAHDLFGDGSAYILDTPGHLAGHVTALLRTSPDGAWLFLGGDVAHDTRLVNGGCAVATVNARGEAYCMHRDVEKAREDIARVRALAELPRVEWIIAHDWKWFEDHVGGDAFLPGRIKPSPRRWRAELPWK
ncbi:beta-lactamase-like protein [Mycena sp. CBHHK59/15]|nr:beta-lactamase-like protein [Mycena sp. CBHHK59/15]